MQRGLVMMNVYAEKVKKYLDEEKIQYSSEDVGEQEENLVVYPSFEAGPNIWAEIEADGALHLTAYLEHDVEEERADWLRNRMAGLSGAKNGLRLVVDEENSVSALQDSRLGREDVGESFAKELYHFLASLNQYIQVVVEEGKKKR